MTVCNYRVCVNHKVSVVKSRFVSKFTFNPENCINKMKIMTLLTQCKGSKLFGLYHQNQCHYLMLYGVACTSLLITDSF